MLKKIITASLLLGSINVHAESIEDLSQWQQDGTSGNWTYNADTNSWFQSENTATGSFLYDPSGNALGKAVAGDITVSGSDDDFIGFAIGYNAGDVTNSDADYFLLTWKKLTQSGLDIGMDLWHVTGSMNSASMWDLHNHSSFRHIAEAKNLADVGWQTNQTYSFDLTYEDHAIGVFLDDALEFGVTKNGAGVDAFAPGGFAFFNFSQGGVTYSGVEYDDINVIVDEQKREALSNSVPLSGGAAALLMACTFGFRRKQ